MIAMSEHGTCAQRLMLFLAGDSPGSRRARSNLANVLGDYDLDDSAVTVINVLSEPAMAVDMSVFATPALVYGSNAPESSLYGDFSDTETLRRFMDDIFGAGREHH
tara:strand:- start:42316 stop:42633 length:318 start_codon:yes stop_codon:yes gene_type:complete